MVVILNWNGFNDTVECLGSLRDAGVDERRVILVDNGSGNDEGARLRDLFPGIKLIQNDHNRGFAGGNNDGIGRAIEDGAEYIALLNNDCIVEKDWLSRLADGMREAGADFAASRIMFHHRRDVICTDGDAVYPDGSGIAVNRYQRPRPGAGNRKIISACAAAALYSAAALEDVKVTEGQYFDELYFAYNEDIDLAMRLAARGYTGITVPGACVYHKHSRTSGRFSFFKMFHSEKNRILNEILDMPLYFFLVGETFFLAKTVWSVPASFFGGGAKSRRYMDNAGFLRVAAALAKARFWVLTHLPEIIRDRGERKARGLIRRGVLRELCWDLNAFGA